MFSTALTSFIQGAGWTTGSLVILGILMAYDPVRDWLVSTIAKKNGLK